MKCARKNENDKASFFPNDVIPQGWENIDISHFNDYVELADGYNDGKYIIENSAMVLNPDYEEQQAERRETEFNKAFFNSSLGYIRRDVTLADGSHKDFLSDFVPTIQMAMSMGQTVNILTYTKPPFDEDITDWTPYQEIKAATPQFIMECATQLCNDFLPINENIGE